MQRAAEQSHTQESIAEAMATIFNHPLGYYNHVSGIRSELWRIRRCAGYFRTRGGRLAAGDGTLSEIAE